MDSKRIYALSLAAWVSFALVGCLDADESLVGSNPLADSVLAVDGVEQGRVDSSSFTITIPATAVVDDSVKIDSLSLPEGFSAYVVIGEDMDDPEIDWDASVGSGGKVAVPSTGTVGIAILDEKNCVVNVWKISVEKVQSSSSKEKSSSSKKDHEEKSSSSKVDESSSEEAESSSAVEVDADKEDPADSGENADSVKCSSSVASSSSSKDAGKLDDSAESSAKSSSSDGKKPASSSSKQTSSSSKKTSSSSKLTSSSSEMTKPVVESSSSFEVVPESSAVVGSSSSMPLLEESSSSEKSSSSSIVQESSSSSAPVWQIVPLSEFSVKNGEVLVSNDTVFVNLPYDTNLRKLTVLPMDTVADLTRSVTMTFANEHGVEGDYHVVGCVQLPGTDFTERDTTGFWATTSDAMANSVTEAAIKMSAGANLHFSSSTATLTTKVVEGSFIGIGGSWKMAGGFYFAGSYWGSSVVDIYQQGYTSGTPNLNASDISKDMTFGMRFDARPRGFDVVYSYSHVKNSNSQYPQKSLIYVMLVSSDNKIVAAGYASDDENKEMGLVHVDLDYGRDAGILDAGFPVAEGLSVGTGKEDVAYIHVMFASSAYAYVVDGGMSGNSGKYRGGEKSALVLEKFNLVY